MRRIMERYLVAALPLVLLSVWILVCSLLTVWVGDDANYIFMIHDKIWNSAGEIEGAGDLFTSLWFHYLGVNGRYVAHLLVQAYCGLWGQTAFAVSNALVYPLFVLSVMRAAGVSLRNVRGLITTVLLVMLSFVTKMMPTCQIGYVWMFMLAVWWLVCYRDIGSNRLPWWQLLLLCILGFVAGNGSEALNIGLAGAIGIEAILRRFRITRGQWFMLISFGIGLAFLICSPAMWQRAEVTHVNATESMLTCLLSLRAFYIAVAVALTSHFRWGRSWSEIYVSNRIFINAAAILMAMNMVIGVYCNRQLFGIELCSVIMILRLLPGGGMSRGWLAALGTLTVMLMCFLMGWLLESRRQFNEIERIMMSQTYSSVYYDRHRSSSSMQAMIGRYDEHTVGVGNADTRHSFSKMMKHRHPEHKRLNIVPTILIGRQNEMPHKMLNMVDEYYPGHFLVITPGKTCPKVEAARSLNVPILHLQLSDRIIDPKEMKDVAGKKSGYGAWLIVPSQAWERIDTIMIRP